MSMLGWRRRVCRRRCRVKRLITAQVTCLRSFSPLLVLFLNVLTLFLSHSFDMQIALLRRATEGGAYKVENSLLATATWLRSFGRSEPAAFSRTLETREEICARGGIGELSGGFGGGALPYVKHAAKFEGAEVGWGTAATGYNDAEPVWRARCAAGRDN